MPEFRAPGRVNLIGDHTDYNEGFVLPVAVDLDCRVRARPRSDGIVRLTSTAFESSVELSADGSAEPKAVAPPWGRLAAGVLTALAARGRDPVGIDGEIRSSVPLGSGLSSSAAVAVALTLALCDAAGFALEPVEIARVCQEAELLATGVPCGIMDQLCSLCAQRDCALLIDCRTLAVEAIPLPPSVVVLAIDLGLPRVLGETAYASRRAECEAVAARLGVPALRDATATQVAGEPRARHVVSENARVLAFADALRNGNTEVLGALMLESHASLRDDFEVSTPEIDATVEALLEAGALGARLTGAGFGGSIVALATVEGATAVVAAAQGKRVHRCRAVDGAAIAAGF